MVALGSRHGTWRYLQRRAAPLVGPRLGQLRREYLGRLISDLERYLLNSLSDAQSAAEFLARLPDVYRSCNDDIYERPMIAEAYAYIHMTSRYCTWWDVFARLFNAGWLPMRESGLRVMDVGAGPGPATYALLDFSQALVRAVSDIEEENDLPGFLTPRPDVVMVESSRAMSHFVHLFSEQRGLGGPFGASLDDFFSLRLIRTREINSKIRQSLTSQIMDEWDVGPDGAEWILREDYPGWHQPERYHLCLISNFLTLQEVLEQAAEALHHMRSTLPPGGMIAVVGAARRAGRFGPIYQELRRQMGGLHHLQLSGIYRPRVDELSQDRLKAFNLSIQQRLTDLGVDIVKEMADWPSGIPGFVLQRWRADNRVVLPRYTLEVFRARHHPMRNRRSRP